jgi:DNA-directed RNA polymerase specialized sigma24 family protein
VQEVLFIAFRAARRGRLSWTNPPPVRVFMRRVARRRIWRWFKTNLQFVELYERDEPTVPGPEGPTVAGDTLGAFSEATSPERWRALIAYAEGISVAEIARREGIPAATVYTRIWKARRDIAAAMTREYAAIYIRRKR